MKPRSLRYYKTGRLAADYTPETVEILRSLKIVFLHLSRIYSNFRSFTPHPLPQTSMTKKHGSLSNGAIILLSTDHPSVLQILPVGRKQGHFRIEIPHESRGQEAQVILVPYSARSRPDYWTIEKNRGHLNGSLQEALRLAGPSLQLALNNESSLSRLSELCRLLAGAYSMVTETELTGRLDTQVAYRLKQHLDMAAPLRPVDLKIAPSHKRLPIRKLRIV